MQLLHHFITRSWLLALTLICVVGGGLTSCEHPIEALEIRGESELVVYAFPSTDDEYLLSVSLTSPMTDEVGKLYVEYVECKTNGKPDEVIPVREESHFGMPMAIFRVKGEHRSGDKISIFVRDIQHREATASTTIPAPTPMEVTSIDTLQGEDCNLRIQMHVRPAATADAHYATRLTSVWETVDNTEYGGQYGSTDEVYHSWDWTNFAPMQYQHLSINPSYEPLLNHYSDLNLDNWNEYYCKMYFFSSDDIRALYSPSDGHADGGIDLHLQTSAPWQTQYIDIQFYTLSREYFLMLRHINDQLSNDLADIGLSQSYSTYSNVRGGFGCVAAYACEHYKYTPPSRDDEIYYSN